MRSGAWVRSERGPLLRSDSRSNSKECKHEQKLRVIAVNSDSRSKE